MRDKKDFFYFKAYFCPIPPEFQLHVMTIPPGFTILAISFF